MSNTLLPCPFCGCKAILCSTGNNFATEKFFVSCGVCGVETPRIARTRKEAIAAWNRRAGDDTNVATNADRIRRMSKARLVFARTETDNVANTWPAMKTVEVELPFENAAHGWEQWQLIGAEWLHNSDCREGF